MSHHFLPNVAITIVGESSVPCTQTEIETESSRSLLDTLLMRWVHGFCARFNIEVRIRTEKTSLSLQKTIFENRSVAYHLRSIEREFEHGLDEATVENFAETHLVIDMDHARFLYLQVTKRVTYADVASARYFFTVRMKISVGEHGKIKKLW